MKLKRPRYPTVVGTAGYFFIQAGHRETAIEHAIQVIGEHAARARKSFAGDPVMAELEAPMESWVTEFSDPGCLAARISRVGEGHEGLLRRPTRAQWQPVAQLESKDPEFPAVRARMSIACVRS